MAHLAAAVADLTGTPEQLAVRRRDLLVPLELQALAGRAEFSTRACAISPLRNQPPLPGPQDCRVRPRARRPATHRLLGAGESAVNTKTWERP